MCSLGIVCVRAHMRFGAMYSSAHGFVTPFALVSYMNVRVHDRVRVRGHVRVLTLVASGEEVWGQPQRSYVLPMITECLLWSWIGESRFDSYSI